MLGQADGSSSPAGFLIGGDVLRLLHGHMDECLTVPSGEHGEEQRRSGFIDIFPPAFPAPSLNWAMSDQIRLLQKMFIHIYEKPS